MTINGFRLISLEKFRFVLEPRYFMQGWATTSGILGRDSAVIALLKARLLLPAGYNFKIWDMHRSREVQIRMIISFRDRIRSEHPGLSELAVMRQVYRYAAKARRVVRRPDCHRNGGAVDLTVVDSCGLELDMGTDHDDLTEKAAFGYFGNLKRKTSAEARVAENRELLKQAMEAAGFDGLPREWWHWSTVQ
ncbi:MAG: M15 family metallopeptidase [Candidatus Saccharibacteria bacterium]